MAVHPAFSPTIASLNGRRTGPASNAIAATRSPTAAPAMVRFPNMNCQLLRAPAYFFALQ
jgi:hypothetical protein